MGKKEGNEVREKICLNLKMNAVLKAAKVMIVKLFITSNCYICNSLVQKKARTGDFLHFIKLVIV